MKKVGQMVYVRGHNTPDHRGIVITTSNGSSKVKLERGGSWTLSNGQLKGKPNI